jgi:hypothetical protein
MLQSFEHLRDVGRFAGQELPRQRRERHEAHAELGAGAEYLALGGSRPQRVLGLHCRNRVHGVCAAQAVGAHFGQPDGPDLALFHQSRERADAFFDRHFRVDAVQVVQVDDVGVQSPQTVFAGLDEHLGTAVHDGFAFLGAREPAFAGEHVLVAPRRQVFADQALVVPQSIKRRGIEKSISLVERCIEQLAGLVVGDTRTVTHRHVHAAQSNRGDLEWSDSSLLHRFLALQAGR